MESDIIREITEFYASNRPYEIIYKNSNSSTIHITDASATIPDGPDIHFGYRGAVDRETVKEFRPISFSQLMSRLRSMTVPEDKRFTTGKCNINRTRGQRPNSAPMLELFINSGSVKLNLDAIDDINEVIKLAKETKLSIYYAGTFSKKEEEKLQAGNVRLSKAYYGDTNSFTYVKGYNAREKRKKTNEGKVYWVDGRCKRDKLYEIFALLKKMFSDKCHLLGYYSIYEIKSENKLHARGIRGYLSSLNGLKVFKYRKSSLWKEFISGIDKAIKAETNRHNDGLVRELKIIKELNESGKPESLKD